MKRRVFLQTASASAIAASWTGDVFCQTPDKRDITYEPDRPLESQGLRIRDVVKILKKEKKTTSRQSCGRKSLKIRMRYLLCMQASKPNEMRMEI